MWAEVGGSIIWVPMDLVKQKLQVQKNQGTIRYRHSFDVIKDIVRNEGVFGMYRVCTVEETHKKLHFSLFIPTPYDIPN